MLACKAKKNQKTMEMRGIEPRTFHMLSECYTTKPHPQVDVCGSLIWKYKKFRNLSCANFLD